MEHYDFFHGGSVAWGPDDPVRQAAEGLIVLVGVDEVLLKYQKQNKVRVNSIVGMVGGAAFSEIVLVLVCVGLSFVLKCV